MAKAQFHKNQRVYVKPVATWALVERVLPQWAKGLDEPLRVHYDLGLGRDFADHELQAETSTPATKESRVESWRVLRARNKWQPAQDCARHPLPGTFPVVVTGDSTRGGWRVPGAEYDLNPQKVERQARIIACAPQLADFAASVLNWARQSGEEMPTELVNLAHDAQDILAHIDGE